MPIPFVNIQKVEEVLKLKATGLTLYQVAKKMETEYKTVLRWYDFGIGNKKYIKRDKQTWLREKLSTN